MTAVSDECLAEDPTANQQNLNNDSPFLPHRIMFSTSIAVLEKEQLEDNGCVMMSFQMCCTFSLIKNHYSDEMLFLCTKAIR